MDRLPLQLTRSKRTEVRLLIDSERKKKKQLILWTILKNCKSSVLLLSLLSQSKMSSERLNDNKKQLDVVRDFKIGHYGRLGRLDAYTGGLGP